MKLFFTSARVLLGLIFTAMGIDYLLHMMPELPISDKGGAFLTALIDSGYLFPLIKAIEVAAGLLLLSGRAVPFALALLSPIALNIVLYHWFLDSNTAWLGYAVGALQALLMTHYRAAYQSLFTYGPPASTSASGSFVAHEVH